MALEAKLLQKLGQNLLMTPQLQQAIKLLQLGRLEYLEAIDRELLENPILEDTKEDDRSEQTIETSAAGELAAAGEKETENTPRGEEPTVDWEDYLENFSDLRGSATPKGSTDSDDYRSLDATLTKAAGLEEHLIRQVRMLDISNEQKTLLAKIIGNLENDGFLGCTHDELAQACEASLQEIQDAIDILRTFDPIGVGARDLAECLLFQLEHRGQAETLEAQIVRKHLDKVERRRYDQIAKEEATTVERVYAAVQAIRALDPRPARQFEDDSTRYITPDVYVYKVAGEYVITLNEDGMPRLRVSPYYLKLLQNQDQQDPTHRAYLHERLKAASWLIKSIHQRQRTIYRVTESIVKFQKDFLDHGISRLRPLILKDVAEDIGMHESTVSRVTTNKYVHTPQGTFELKYFFTTGIKSSDGDVSSSSIKERIRAIIASESETKPISDQEIVDLLKREQIEIARRTVAKYRESLGILSSSKRKRLF